MDKRFGVARRSLIETNAFVIKQLKKVALLYTIDTFETVQLLFKLLFKNRTPSDRFESRDTSCKGENRWDFYRLTYLLGKLKYNVK